MLGAQHGQSRPASDRHAVQMKVDKAGNYLMCDTCQDYVVAWTRMASSEDSTRNQTSRIVFTRDENGNVVTVPGRHLSALRSAPSIDYTAMNKILEHGYGLLDRNVKRADRNHRDEKEGSVRSISVASLASTPPYDQSRSQDEPRPSGRGVTSMPVSVGDRPWPAPPGLMSPSDEPREVPRIRPTPPAPTPRRAPAAVQAHHGRGDEGRTHGVDLVTYPRTPMAETHPIPATVTHPTRPTPHWRQQPASAPPAARRSATVVAHIDSISQLLGVSRGAPEMG